MTVQRILQFPKHDKLLRKKSSKIRRVNEVKSLIRDLKDTLAAREGAGLAAPQIGVFNRVIIVRFGQDEGEMRPPIALINPKVLETGEPSKGFDGCLSIPNFFTWDTLRPSWLIVSALDENGRKIRIKVDGIDARLIHHEIDHLDGILFLDRLQSQDDLYLLRETDEDEERFVKINHLMLSDKQPTYKLKDIPRMPFG